MNSTLGIYGIQDIDDNDFPNLIHDHNICFAKNGRILKYAQLERISGRKYDNTLHKWLYKLLKSERIINENPDLIFVDAVVGRSFISADGKVRFEVAPDQKLYDDLQEGIAWWFGKKKTAYAISHELAHIYSCVPFYGMFKENSLLVHFDGGASVSNFSAWIFRNGRISLSEYHWKLKYLSSLFNANALNFSILGVKRRLHNSLPGKFMGFAAYGKYSSKIESWLRENNFFENIWHDKKQFFDSVKEKFNLNINSFDTHNKFLQDIAATVQHIFTEDTVNFLRELQKQTQTEYLYYSGGSALSIVTNKRILESNIFKGIYIPPCTNDSGLSIGAAAALEIRKKNIIKKHSPYLNNWDLHETKSSYDELLIEKVADLLLKNKLIAICRNYGETGPRALGNRSIICLANNKELSEKLSISIKKREWYRPLAPVMLAEHIEYFTGKKEVPEIAEFMLYDFDIKPNKRKEIIGAVHADGTARIQVVSNRNQNAFIFDLLKYLSEKFSIKALINTSFNSAGKPIVHNCTEAIAEARKMGLDAIVSENNLIVYD